MILLRGTWIILKFVKDKTNLVPHNVWTGTDYSADTTGFNHTCIESSTEWSYNGTRSLKLNRFQEGYNNYTTSFVVTLPQANYIFTCRLYAPHTKGNIILLTKEGNLEVQFSENESVQLITLSATNRSVDGVRFVNWSPNTSCFIDEISIRVNQ